MKLEFTIKKKKTEIEEDISSRLPFIYQLQEELFFESDADDSRIFQQQVISREGPRHVQHQSLCFEGIMIWLSQVIGVAKMLPMIFLLLILKRFVHRKKKRCSFFQYWFQYIYFFTRVFSPWLFEPSKLQFRSGILKSWLATPLVVLDDIPPQGEVWTKLQQNTWSKLDRTFDKLIWQEEGNPMSCF